MPSEPIWLTIDDLIVFNKGLVAETGEAHGILSENLINSALDKPKNHYFYNGVDDVVTLACLLMMGIARNHGFEQANKRTGFAAAQAFAEYNGYRLTTPDDRFADLIIAAIEHTASDEIIENVMRAHTEPLPDE